MNFTKIFLNFLSMVLLISLIAAPIYFAHNFAKVAGVKSESKYLIVSQLDKFPNLKLTQTGDQYQLSFTKLGPSQAFLDILIINNPTDQTQDYTINAIDGQAKIFFGHDTNKIETTIAVPSQTSVPISLYSGSEASASSQTVEFKIVAQ